MKPWSCTHSGPARAGDYIERPLERVTDRVVVLVYCVGVRHGRDPDGTIEYCTVLLCIFQYCIRPQGTHKSAHITHMFVVIVTYRWRYISSTVESLCVDLDSFNCIDM
jgi:hypothetical protein